VDGTTTTLGARTGHSHNLVREEEARAASATGE